MKNLTSAIVVGFVFSAITLCAAGRDTLFNYRFEESRYLRYVGMYNSFDSVTVACIVGEIALNSSNAVRHISFHDSTLLNTKVTGSEQGVQSSILGALRSRVFVISGSEDTLSFYRQLCLYPQTNDTNIVSAWSIPELTEFVIQLRKSSNDSVLCVVDSVGYDSTIGLSTTASSYGTSPENWCGKKHINTNWKGTPVYLQLVPKRWGSGQYGIEATSSTFEFSLSVFYQCGLGRISAQQSSDLVDTLHSRILTYWADVWETDCLAAGYPNGTPLPPELIYTLQHTYFELDTVVAGDSLFRVKDCELQKSVGSNARRVSKAINRWGLSSCTYDNGWLEYSVFSEGDAPIQLLLIHLTTGVLLERVEVFPNSGTAQGSISVNLPSGPYVFQVMRGGYGQIHKFIVK